MMERKGLAWWAAGKGGEAAVAVEHTENALDKAQASPRRQD